MTKSTQDQWAQWLLQRRHGGDTEKQKSVLKALVPIRDQVLQNARLASGETLLDLGCGDGLIAFGALEMVGEQGRVIFSDISQDLLEYSRSLALQMGVIDRCQFLHTSADDLKMIKANSVDVVTARSVLIYVQAKQQAFDECYRVLKPNGRLSIFEPINRFAPRMFGGYDLTPISDIVHKIRAVYERIQPIETDPMLNFDERDLLTFAEKAGFTETYLDLQVEIVPGKYKRESQTEEPNWEAFVRSSGNPLIPTIEEAMNQVLTPDEAEQFAAYLRPLFEAKRYVRRFATAYLWAVKHEDTVS